MRKTFLLAAMAAFIAPGLEAAAVRLTDGSVLKGDVTQVDGRVTVKTLAGDVTVPKDKVVSIVENGEASEVAPSAAGAPLGAGLGGVNSPYVDDVLRRRAKYGNSDGLHRTALIQSRQLLFTLGQLNYVGDAYLVKDGANTALNSSDLGSLSYGLAFSDSFNDFIAWELWGDYSAVTKSYAFGIGNASTNLNRFDIGVGPKIQHAIPLDGPERDFLMIPNFGITPFYAASSGSTVDSNGNSISLNHGNVGASMNVGLDFQFAGALIAVKARYLLSNDVNGGLHSSNTSAWMPQIGAGFAF